ncbi:hypothetical protein P872_11860 [Rhodonellum psychrophilum GCM71 = DSM 17998]|uniref:Uncharacterized protein n=1 Tax=Rhodonellum psychrophilum GCM71 = DSM 17998 TaxID=1123057 RepID=U5BK86_9BACT|nr:hypothetical protein P872_11860 [Rhodonellum psychrophilum GCM71 = DSM 17998]
MKKANQISSVEIKIFLKSRMEECQFIQSSFVSQPVWIQSWISDLSALAGIVHIMDRSIKTERF